MTNSTLLATMWPNISTAPKLCPKLKLLLTPWEGMLCTASRTNKSVWVQSRVLLKSEERAIATRASQSILFFPVLPLLVIGVSINLTSAGDIEISKIASAPLRPGSQDIRLELPIVVIHRGKRLGAGSRSAVWIGKIFTNGRLNGVGVRQTTSLFPKNR